jgi:hypothetical protein
MIARSMLWRIPPRRVGREAEAALGLELADRVHQAEVAFLDQVGHRQAAAEVVLSRC